MNDIFFYVLMFVSALITAFSQVLLKISADKKHKSFIFEYLNPYVLVSYFCYGIVLLLNIYIYTVMDYRFGVVINSLGMVLVMLLSWIVLKEKISKRKVFGNALVILGIVCFTLL